MIARCNRIGVLRESVDRNWKPTEGVPRMGPCYMLSQGGRFRTPPGASRTPPDFFGPLRGATVIHPCSTVANTGESTPGDACSGVRLVVFGNTGGPRSGPPVFFGPLRGAFWAPAARPTWSLGTFCSGFPAPAPPNPDLTNLLDPPNLHTGFYLYLWAYEVHSRPAGKWPLAGRQGSGLWPGGREVGP